ncbi:MAG: hypothetical protein R3E11_06140 [Sphingobium sp.]|nr:hypothetical protein [Sphingobium sp.]MCP5399073.1 hypothetical protein [Sphingomonas sp.]
MKQRPGIEDVVAKVSRSAFGKPLITNVLRGHLVEAIIALALEPDWRWCSEDYASWDFERADGIRLEVKQSAAKQTWAPPKHGRINPSFDIKPRTGRWEGARFINEAGRNAHLYVFAYHGLLDETADHRNPNQWCFYCVRTSDLPGTKRISLASVAKLAKPIPYERLMDQVQELCTDIWGH